MIESTGIVHLSVLSKEYIGSTLHKMGRDELMEVTDMSLSIPLLGVIEKEISALERN